MRLFNYITAISICISFLFTATLTQAADSDIFNRGTSEDPASGKVEVTTPLADPNESYLLLGGLISTVINIILIAAGVTSFAFFIIGAIQWGTAGSGDGAAKGRMTMIYAAIGLVAVGLVYVFILFFNNLLPSALPTPDCAPGTTC